MSRMGIVTFSARSKTYKFKEPLMLKTEHIGDGICLIHKDLSLSACGKSFSECETIIREELATLWEEYALVPDYDLSLGALIFKNQLLAMVEEVK